MLIQASGKTMTSFAVGHEIQIIALLRAGSGHKRLSPRIADWSRRQTVIQISIVGTVDFQVGAFQTASERSFALRNRINYRRIGLQPHTFLQTVQKHGSHQRSFFRHTGFLFDNRSERQQFVNVLQRQTAVAGSPDFFQRFLHSGPRLQDNAVCGWLRVQNCRSPATALPP